MRKLVRFGSKAPLFIHGHGRRGMGETIRAVVWLCDLRGFTTLSEELSRDRVIDLLNAYFGVMCQVIEQHQGEVLKFVNSPAAARDAR